MPPQGRSEPSPAPRLAATVLLVRDGDAGLEVFMVVRHRQIEFASGALVFPGGSAEPADFTLAAGLDRCGLPFADDERLCALRVAAVRETFEECGVLLARPRAGKSAGRAKDLVGGVRVAELVQKAASATFADLLESEDLEPAIDLLTPFAHWITPPILSKRFDTYFFIAAAPADHLAAHDGLESVDSAWLNPSRALGEVGAGRYTMLFPTRLNLEMLGREADAASALEAARRRKIVTVLPEATKREDGSGYWMRIPADAGYGDELFSV